MGNFSIFDLTFLPGDREFDSNFWENVKIPPDFSTSKLVRSLANLEHKCLLVDIFLTCSLSKSLAFCVFVSVNFKPFEGDDTSLETKR